MTFQASARVLTKLEKIRLCPDEFQLSHVVQQITHILGAENYAFVLYQPNMDESGHPAYRYLIGCDPRWSQIYIDRKWYMIDPDIEYAKRNSAPTVASRLPAQTSGQSDVRGHAEDSGFRSKLIVPAHHPSPKRTGILFVGKSQPPSDGERLLLQHHMFFRLLAIEMLDWYAKMLRDDAIRAIGLVGDEAAVLDFYHRGYSANDIASELRIGVRTVYQYFQNINGKFKVLHISHAVKAALSMGILV